MTAQAGWYAAPGEPGILRYWSGEAWTDHRQPAPPVGIPVVVAAEPVNPIAPVVMDSAADVMRPFEAQFTPEQQLGSVGSYAAHPQQVPTAPPQFQAPSFVPPQPQLQWGQPQPPYAPQQYGQSQQYAQPEYGQLPPVQQPRDYASAGSESPFQHFLGEARSAAGNPANQGLAEEVGGAALAADGLFGFGRGRQGIGGAIRGMGLGVIFIVIGFLLLGYMSSQSTAGAGQKEIAGVVTSISSSTSTDSQGNTNTTCSPLAKYTVAGATYTATSNIGMSPCPYQVGQSVGVIYSTTSPSNAHVAESGSTYSWMWIFPIAGALAFLIGLWTFIKRAGSIAAGVALIFNGRKRRAASFQQP